MNIEGWRQFSSSQIYNCLSDLGVFRDNRRIRLIVKSALEYGLFSLFISKDSPHSNIDRIVFQLENDGFMRSNINEVIQAFNTVFSTNTNNKNITKDAIKTFRIIAKTNSANTPVSFLGIPLGQTYEAYRKALLENGANIENDHLNKYPIFSFERFLFGYYTQIYLTPFENSDDIQLITVVQTVPDEKRREERIEKLKEYYISCYGQPTNDLSWQFQSAKITISEFYIQEYKVCIEYRYLNHISNGNV